MPTWRGGRAQVPAGSCWVGGSYVRSCRLATAPRLDRRKPDRPDPKIERFPDERRNRQARFRFRPGSRIAFPSARSEEHTSELQSLMRISYAVFCLKKKQQQEYHKT